MVRVCLLIFEGCSVYLIGLPNWHLDSDSKHHSWPVNPVFYCTVHVNPKFNKKALTKSCGFFDKMKEKVRCQPNIVTYNILLRAYAQACQGDKVNALFKDVETNEIRTNVYTYNGVMDAYGKH